MVKTTIILGLGLIALAAFLNFNSYNQISNDHNKELRTQTNFEVVYKQITSYLRIPLVMVSAKNDVIVGGDQTGGINIWTFDEKKKKLQFQDTSRSIVPVLEAQNNVIAMDSLTEGVVVLTQDGKLTTYAVNSAEKVTGKISINSSDAFSDFKIIQIDNNTYFTTISASKKDVCLYKTSQSIIRPNPITKLGCNTPNKTLSGISYDSINQLVAVGDYMQALIYKVNVTDDKAPFSPLCQANLPKAEVQGFDSEFKNGTLLAVNDLWLSSIIIDLDTPSAKVLASARTESGLVKKGQTTTLSVNQNDKSKQTLVLVNAKNLLKGYSLEKNNKLATKGDSSTLGRTEQFSLLNEQTLFAGQGIMMTAYSVGGNSTSNDGYISYLDDKPIASDNHYQKVNKLAYWNNTLVSVSDGGTNNIKLWKKTDFSLSQIDDHTIGYFSLLKSGNMALNNIALLPPKSKANANQTLHIVTAGAEPYQIVFVNFNTQGKIANVKKSNDSHSSNITSLFVTPDYKTIVTASMDTLIKVWNVATTHDMANVSSIITTKYGPINLGLQDKTGQFYVFGHCNNNVSNLVNITVWQTDSKKGLIKIAENTPSQAHQSNLTDLIFSKDQKYIISLSQSGQLRLWQHKDFTMVDLLASLSIGIVDVSMTVTDSNKLILQSKTQFIQYSFDFNGFILEGRKSKQYQTGPSSMLVVEDKLYSGDADGAIRTYQYTD